MNIDKGTIIRTTLLVVALINSILSASGKPILPVEDAQLEILISTGATVIISMINWWKNNSFTDAAKEGDKVMRGLKAGK